MPNFGNKPQTKKSWCTPALWAKPKDIISGHGNTSKVCSAFQIWTKHNGSIKNGLVKIELDETYGHYNVTLVQK